MANIENIPLQDNYDTTLTNRLEKLATAVTIEVKDTPSYTPTNTKTKAIINPGKSNAELVIITDYDATNRTITIETDGRAQPLYKGDTGTIQEHVSGSQLIISDNYAFWNEIAESNNSKADQLGLPNDVYADAIARDAALPTPSNGMQCYLEDTGMAYDYLAGSWVERSSGGTFPNASETVAGKVEIATEAQVLAGDDTGETGAKLVFTPASTAITDTAQTEAGYIPKTKASGAIDKELVEVLQGTGATVTAESLDAVTDGSVADAYHSHTGLGVVTATAGEAIDGSTTPKAIFIGDGSVVVDTINQSYGTIQESINDTWAKQTFLNANSYMLANVTLYLRSGSSSLPALLDVTSNETDSFHTVSITSTSPLYYSFFIKIGSYLRFDDAGGTPVVYRSDSTSSYPDGVFTDSTGSVIGGDAYFNIDFYDETIIEQPEQSSLFNLNSSTSQIIQSFIPAKMSRAGVVVLKGAIVGSPDLPILELFLADSNGEPIGSVLATGSMLYDTGTFISQFDYSFDSISSYVIKLRAGATTDSTNYYSIFYKDADVYSDGAAKTSSDTGATWSTSIGDVTFEITGVKSAKAGLVYKSDENSMLTNYFDGFTSSNKDAFENVTFKTVGQESGFTGLTLGQKYYIDADGELAETGSVEAGRAISDTDIYIA